MRGSGAAAITSALLFTAAVLACGSRSAAVRSGPSQAAEGRNGATPALEQAEAPSQEPAMSPAASGKGATGPYATLDAAEAFVGSQPAFAQFRPDFIDTEVNWRPSATLHVVRAAPFGTADYGGDYYYFFVNGNVVGRQYFTHARDDSPTDDVTFTIAYDVYRRGDAHCCPSGGTRAVRFHWNGTSLVALDPVTGATQ